jgi:hypothetical protein
MIRCIGLTVVIVFIGCNTPSKTRSEYNRDYYKRFTKIMGESGANLYQFDPVGYDAFIKNESPVNLRSVVYSFFLNDTLQIYPKLIYTSVPNCKTSMLREIKGASSFAFDRNEAVLNKTVFTSHLINLKTNLPYSTAEERKIKVVLLYGKTMSNFFKKFYREAKEICGQENCELIIVSLDAPM